jgi:hypothetical protein
MQIVALFFAIALALIPAFASAQVITGDGTINQNPNGSYSRSFTVTGTNGHIYDFSSSCTGYVATCGVPSQRAYGSFERDRYRDVHDRIDRQRHSDISDV